MVEHKAVEISAINLSFTASRALEFCREVAYHQASNHPSFNFGGQIIYIPFAIQACERLCAEGLVSAEECKAMKQEGKEIATKEQEMADDIAKPPTLPE